MRKAKEIKNCNTPLVIGETYLDTWGREHSIMGEAKPLGRPSPGTVWSSTGYHYSKETGECLAGGHHLVSIKSPEKEVKFWLARLKQIRSVNHEYNLRLVNNDLNRMRARVNLLMGTAFLSVEEDLSEPLPPPTVFQTWWKKHYGVTKGA